ncbi:MAG: HepT-like ribonuclease domain-containing protein [Thermoleophilia bacterium]
MTLHDDDMRLRHMLDYSHEALELVKNRRRSDLDNDRVLELALVRLLEIIGEAASRVSEEGRERNPEIPWPQIISLRNRLIHGYDSIDMDVLWEILQGDLPALISKLEK